MTKVAQPHHLAACAEEQPRLRISGQIERDLRGHNRDGTAAAGRHSVWYRSHSIDPVVMSRFARLCITLAATVIALGQSPARAASDSRHIAADMTDVAGTRDPFWLQPSRLVSTAGMY